MGPVKIAGMREIHALLVLGTKPDSAPGPPSHMKAADTAAGDEACHAAAPHCSCAPRGGHKGTGQEGQLAGEEEGCSSSSDTGSNEGEVSLGPFLPAPQHPPEKGCIDNGGFYLLTPQSSTFQSLSGGKSVLLTGERRKKTNLQSGVKML